MAIQRENQTSFTTTLTDSGTGNVYRVASSVTEKRVATVQIYVTPGDHDTTSNYSESAKKAFHDAIVDVLMNQSSGTNKGIGYGL